MRKGCNRRRTSERGRTRKGGDERTLRETIGLISGRGGTEVRYIEKKEPRVGVPYRVSISTTHHLMGDMSPTPSCLYFVRPD